MSLILSGTDGLSDIDGSAATPAIRGTDANTGIFFPAADTIAFSEGGVESMRIDSSGNVGIGTASPGYTLDVVGSSRVYSSTAGLNTAKFGASRAGDYVFLDGLCSPLASNGYSIFGMRAYSSLASAGVQVGGSEWVHEGAGTDNKSYYTISTHSGTALAERMRINSSGDVGIGTASPGTLGNFEVQATSGNMTGVAIKNNATGNVLFGGSYTNISMASEGATFQITQVGGSGFLYGGAASVNFVQGSNAPMTFSTNSTERMRIDASGGLILVGSTAQKATGTTWSNPSDRRLKDNIRDYGKGLAELMQVRVREWEYNGKGGTVEGTKGLGVVADEVMTVLPDTVENYDAKLNSDDEETTAIKKFDATEITWLLVKTVQEQQALITALTARITALETP